MSVIPRRLASGVLVLALACSSSSSPRRARYVGDDVIRYRLQLRHNPVDPGGAFRCYGSCQSQSTPNGYVECLKTCPGFEITNGAYCAKDEVPPVAACLTVRTMKPGKEIDPGLIVLAVVGNVLLVVGAATLCASSSSQCGYATLPYNTRGL